VVVGPETPFTEKRPDDILTPSGQKAKEENSVLTKESISRESADQPMQRSCLRVTIGGRRGASNPDGGKSGTR